MRKQESQEQLACEQFDLAVRELARGRTAEAINLLELAASHKNAEAAWRLAKIFEDEKYSDTVRDKERAFHWLERAAELRGVKQNWRDALKWYTLAFEA